MLVEIYNMPGPASPTCKYAQKVLFDPASIYQSPKNLITTKYFVFTFLHFVFLPSGKLDLELRPSTMFLATEAHKLPKSVYIII